MEHGATEKNIWIKKLKNLFNLRCYMLLDLSIPVVWYLVRLIRVWHVVSPVSRVPANQHRAFQQPIKIETLWAVVLDFWAVLRDSPRYVYLVLHYHHWRRAGVARPNYIIVSVRPSISLIGTTVKVSVIFLWKFITWCFSWYTAKVTCVYIHVWRFGWNTAEVCSFYFICFIIIL